MGWEGRVRNSESGGAFFFLIHCADFENLVFLLFFAFIYWGG